jgi:hypothetical protein
VDAAGLRELGAAISAVRDGQRKTSLSSESGALTYMNIPLPDLVKLCDAIHLELNAALSGSLGLRALTGCGDHVACAEYLEIGSTNLRDLTLGQEMRLR